MGFGLVSEWVGQGFVYVTGGGGDMAYVRVYDEFVVLAGSGLRKHGAGQLRVMVVRYQEENGGGAHYGAI
nr:hypothetical protein CFP56_51546 [Quercus suber]